MQNWKMANKGAGLEYDGLAVHVGVQKTQLNEGGCRKH